MPMWTMELKMITPHSRYDTFHTPYIQVWIIDFFHMACTNMGGGYAPTCMLAKLQELDDMISMHWMSCPDNWCTAKGNKSINAWYILELKGQGLNCRTICLPLKQWDFWSPLNRSETDSCWMKIWPISSIHCYRNTIPHCFLRTCQQSFLKR